MIEKQQTSAIAPEQSMASTAVASVEFTPISHNVVMVYHIRSSVINTIKQLVSLCRETQQHRGLGMGLLAGNKHFTDRFFQLQLQMKRRVQILHAFFQEAHCQLKQVDMASINDGWQTIHEGWHDDSVLENFQFHGHFIEQQLKIITRLSSCLHRPLGTFGLRHSLQAKEAIERNQTLLDFICAGLPHLIEFIGKIRALSTHAATCGHHMEEYDKQLKFFCQCVHAEKLKMIHTAENLHQSMGSHMPSLLLLKTYEFKLSAFIDKILQQVVAQETIHIASTDIFSMATEIMDTYWRVVEDGLDVLQGHQEQALEQWCQQG